MSLWFNTSEEQRHREDESFPKVVALSEAFYQEIDQHLELWFLLSWHGATPLRRCLPEKLQPLQIRRRD